MNIDAQTVGKYHGNDGLPRPTLTFEIMRQFRFATDVFDFAPVVVVVGGESDLQTRQKHGDNHGGKKFFKHDVHLPMNNGI